MHIRLLIRLHYQYGKWYVERLGDASQDPYIVYGGTVVFELRDKWLTVAEDCSQLGLCHTE